MYRLRNNPSPGRRQTILLFLFAFLFPGLRVWAGDPAQWRFFQAPQGAEESWTSHVSVGPGNRIWVAHGSTRTASWLDGWPDAEGRLLSRIPSPGQISKIRESPQGQIWAMSEKGLQLFRDGQWVNLGIEIEDSLDVFGQPIRIVPFLPVEKDRVFCLYKKCLLLFDAARGRKEQTVLAERTGLGDFIDLAGARDGGMWITGERGVSLFRRAAGADSASWREFKPPWPWYVFFKSPVEGRQGELFLVAEDNRSRRRDLLVYDHGRWQVKTGHTGSVLRGWPGLDDSYWVIKEEGTLYWIKPGKGESRQDTGVLSGEIFNELAQEDNGVFWLATSRGLARHTPPLWRSPAGFPAEGLNWCHKLYEDSRGRIWLAVERSILVRDSTHWQSYEMPANIRIWDHMGMSFFSVSGGRIGVFYAAGTGCYLIRPSGLEKITSLDYPDGAKGMKFYSLAAPGRDDKVWLTTGSDSDPGAISVKLYDGRELKTVFETQTLSEITSILETSNGNLWISSVFRGRGLSLFKDGKLRHIGPEEGYTGQGGVFCLHEFEDGTLWAGGRNEIYEYDGHRWSLVRDWGLDNVYSIGGRAGGSRWVASTTGVHRFHDGVWVTYTEADGLPSTSANFVIEDSRGTVWAATTQGVSCFHPEADADPPETLIQPGDNLAEVPPSGQARLVFSAVDKWNFTQPERLFFSWRLDSGEWSPYQTNRLAWLSGLSYGRHSFEVRAMDVNFNSDPYPAHFDFTVLLPWYRETGFLVIMSISGCVILVLLGYALHRHFTLERLVGERTDALQRTNIRLLRSLRHERLLANIASLFNSGEGFHENVDPLLALIGEGIEVVAVKLFEREAGGEYRNIGAWSTDSGSGPRSSIRNRSKTILKSLRDRLDQGQSYAFTGLEELKRGDRGFFQREGIEAAYVLPVRTDERVLGCICFCQNSRYFWSEDERKLFEAITGMLATIWERHRYQMASLAAENKHAEALQTIEQASRVASIGVISAGITHEINQPLNNIKVIADIILFWSRKDRDSLPERYHRWLLNISENVKRISEIVQQMRSYWVSRYETNCEPLELNAVVRGALPLIQKKLASHSVTLELLEQGAGRSISANRMNLEQIVLNILINSVHALDNITDRERKITILIAGSDKSARLEISDNGPGIPEADIGRIFDPFYSTKAPELGMGLGLAIVKRFVEEFGGRIRAENLPDCGVRFVMEFPCLEPAPARG
ncbi:hypothetical protein LLH00_10340 [bacterium]|nr:hypothetical protein [bacterium]